MRASPRNEPRLRAFTPLDLGSPNGHGGAVTIQHERVVELLAAVNEHNRAGRYDDAQRCCDEVLAIAPTHPEAARLAGVVAARRGRIEDAITWFARAIALAPGEARAHQNLGSALARAGRTVEAVASLRRAVALAPTAPEGWQALGVALGRAGDARGAIAPFERLVELQPTSATAWTNLASALQATGDAARCEAACRRAIELAPSAAAPRLVLGSLAYRARRWDDAAEALRHAVRLAPADADAWMTFGAALQRVGSIDEAVASGERAIGLAPLSAGAHTNLGHALLLAGRVREAEESLRRAIELAPSLPSGPYNLAYALLLTGRLREGFAAYAHRHATPEWPARVMSTPAWRGERVAGTILLMAEQGLGDTLQFVRYARLVAERCERVVLECQADVASLCLGVAGVDAVMRQGEPSPPHDVHAHLLDLPGLFGTDLESIPADVPYLRAPRPAPPLDGPGLRVGLVWAGSATHDNDRSRSIALAALRPLVEVAGVSLFSLQVGERRADLASTGLGARVCDVGGTFRDFADTAAAVAALDVVVTVDTSVAHLAGGLGTRVFTLLPTAPDWRWLLERSDSPWYPTMRLFRQRERGDWAPVVVEVARALAELASSGR